MAVLLGREEQCRRRGRRARLQVIKLLEHPGQQLDIQIFGAVLVRQMHIEVIGRMELQRGGKVVLVTADMQMRAAHAARKERETKHIGKNLTTGHHRASMRSGLRRGNLGARQDPIPTPWRTLS